MILRNAIRTVLSSLAVALAVGLAQSAQATEHVKIGTLAPASSPWGQVFRTWAQAVKQKTNGQCELDFFYNGTQGDEGAMVGKMKSGQLDGAAVTAVGLSKIYKPVLALQMPGLFTSWDKLDAARDALKGEFERGISDAGFKLVGWGDVGQIRMMTKGFEVHTPQDLKGKKPYMWRDDIIQPVLFQVIGGITPVPLNVPEVLPQLNTGTVNVVSVGALAAEQLQWAARLDHIVTNVSSIQIGAIVLASKRFEALPAELKSVVADTGRIAATALTTRIRNEDAAAFDRLKGKMTATTLSAAEDAQWSQVFKDVRQRLSQGTFPADLVAKLESLAK